MLNLSFLMLFTFLLYKGLNRFDATLQNSDETLLLGNQQANIPQKPLAVPRDLVKRIQAFHSFPFGWFIGQIFKYMWKPNIPMMRYMLMARKELNLYRPIVGYVNNTDCPVHGYMAFCDCIKSVDSTIHLVYV